jgi:glycosyltransferase involved in cell wall biosynthesis
LCVHRPNAGICNTADYRRIFFAIFQRLKLSEPPPLVSVIMSMRNGASTVGAAIRSVVVQTLRDWEMIVIDNGSSDQSSAIVERFRDERIRLVREPRSDGLAARLNQAVGLSRGEFIARMDADDICFPERLSRQVARLCEDRQLDLIGCGAVVFTSKGELVGELPVGLVHEEIVSRPFVGFPFPHPTWCGRASWFRENPYDATLQYAEDQDLILRSFRHSKLGGLDKVLFGYRQDRLALKKLLPGRATFMGSVWRNAVARGEVLPALAGIANHAAKGVLDVATLGLGLNRQMQLRRLKPVPPAIEQEWRRLFRDLRASSGPDRNVG